MICYFRLLAALCFFAALLCEGFAGPLVGAAAQLSGINEQPLIQQAQKRGGFGGFGGYRPMPIYRPPAYSPPVYRAPTLPPAFRQQTSPTYRSTQPIQRPTMLQRAQPSGPPFSSQRVVRPVFVRPSSLANRVAGALYNRSQIGFGSTQAISGAHSTVSALQSQSSLAARIAKDLISRSYPQTSGRNNVVQHFAARRNSGINLKSQREMDRTRISSARITTRNFLSANLAASVAETDNNRFIKSRKMVLNSSWPSAKSLSGQKSIEKQKFFLIAHSAKTIVGFTTSRAARGSLSGISGLRAKQTFTRNLAVANSLADLNARLDKIKLMSVNDQPRSADGLRSIFNPEAATTAKNNQSRIPRDFNEQILWNQAQRNPAFGHHVLENSDARFLRANGWSKMRVTHDLPDGTKIAIHYQYNEISGRVADMKLVTPQRVPPQLQPFGSKTE